MKNTKANVIELLKKLEENSRDCAKSMEEDGNKEFADRLREEARAYYECRQLLTNKKHFEAIAKIFFEE